MSGIYIHIPFCKQACHYCDFHFSTGLKNKNALVFALIRELELRKEEFKDAVVKTIYFGGGTPSLLSIEELQLILKAVYNNYKVSKAPEITLEANPDDLISVKAQSRTIFEDYISIGINRLSIGVQSFFRKDLELMNRAHNAHEAKECIEEAIKHFDNLSIDLIYGIPGTTSEEWTQNIETTLSYNIPHISSYALTVEPKTVLDHYIKKGLVKNVDDDMAHEQFNILVKKLKEANYVHYELSNFGKEGFFSQNNTAYWSGKSYIGIGPSAHSFNGSERSWNIRNNTKYIKTIAQGILPMEKEALTEVDKFNELIMTGLRTMWGVSLQQIEVNFRGAFKNHLLKQAQPYLEQNLLCIENETLKTTVKGQFLADGIASDLFKVN